MRVRAAITALAAMTATLFAAAPAHAVDTELALAACRQGVGGAFADLHLSPQDIAEYAGSPAGALQAQIRPGAVVKVTATGKISYGGVFNWRGTWGPDGNGQTAPNNSAWPFPGGPDAALVGSWNHTGQNIRVGSDSGCMVVPPQTIATAPHGLWLRANDDWLHDNGDRGYDIRVTAWLF